MQKRILRAQPRVPSYRRHKATGRAVVTLNGRDLYLPGRYGSQESRAAYDRAIAEWLAAGRRAIVEADEPGVTVTELAAAYWTFAVGYYKNPHSVRSALRPLRRLYGPTPVAEFGPKNLRAVLNYMAQELGWARSFCNEMLGTLKRVFRFGVAEELAPGEVYQALLAVEGLKKGRTAARETAPVGPVADQIYQATLPHLPEVVASLCQFIRFTGCRPGEACQLRPCDVDSSAPNVWVFTPETHKTQHRGRERKICIGPRARAVLRPYLLRPAESRCFSPADSERKRHRGQREGRKTKVQPSQCDRKKARPARAPGEQYTAASLRKAIERACVRAGVAVWKPNQLRHAAATEIRQRFGLEAAQTALGHAAADVTQIYAERDQALAARVAVEVG